MQTFEYIIKDSLGIHARPAGLLAKEAGKFSSEVTVSRGEKSASAKKLFQLMGLCIKQGEKIVVSAQGKDEEDAIQAVSRFLTDNL